MPLYIAPYIGSGTKLDMYRPKYSDEQEGWSAIDLRPDASVVDGLSLLWLPNDHSAVNLYKLGVDKNEAPSPGILTSVASKLQLAIGKPVTNLSSLLSFLLFNDHGAGKWNPVQYGTWSRKKEIWLAGELWAESIYSGEGPLPFDPTDNFTRSDENPIASPWVSGTGSHNDLQIASNLLASVTDNSDSSAYYNASFDSDHSSEITIDTLGTNSDFGAACRCQSGAATLYISSAYSPSEQIAKIVSGSYTTILAVTVSNLIASDLLRCEAEGSTIRYIVNDSEIDSVTDTSITGGYPGVFMYKDDARISFWTGADLVVGGVTGKSNPMNGPFGGPLAGIM